MNVDLQPPGTHFLNPKPPFDITVRGRTPPYSYRSPYRLRKRVGNLPEPGSHDDAIDDTLRLVVVADR